LNSPSFVYRELAKDIDQPMFIYLFLAHLGDSPRPPLGIEYKWCQQWRCYVLVSAAIGVGVLLVGESKVEASQHKSGGD
jgi:hypothetical protein